MALISCPSCKREVSSEAAACPHCGHPIKPVAPSKKAKDSGGGCGGLIAGSMLIVAMIILIGRCSGGSSAPSATVTPPVKSPEQIAADAEKEKREYETCRALSDEAIKSRIFSDVGGESGSSVLIMTGSGWHSIDFAQQKVIVECLSKTLGGGPGFLKPLIIMDPRTRVVYGRAPYGVYRAEVPK